MASLTEKIWSHEKLKKNNLTTKSRNKNKKQTNSDLALALCLCGCATSTSTSIDLVAPMLCSFGDTIQHPQAGTETSVQEDSCNNNRGPVPVMATGGAGAEAGVPPDLGEVMSTSLTGELEILDLDEDARTLVAEEEW